MAKVRAKNTATAKDMMGCFVLWSREIDVESFRLSEQQVIVQNERLFSEILEKTVRPGQKEVQQGLSMAYQIVWTKPRLFPKVSAMRSSLLEAKSKAVPVERNWSLQCGSLCRG